MATCWFCYQITEDEQPYHEKCCRRFFGKSKAPVLMLDKKLLTELARQTVNQRIAVTGVQPKLSVTLETARGTNRLTIVGLWGEYILKPQHDQYGFMPENEDLTMHLASLFNLPVCEHTLLKTSNNEWVYLAKRFDRWKGKKTHMEDFCQLSEFLTENKYKGSYEKAGKLVLKYGTNKGLDALNFFELVLFSYLTGNNDMHLKNFSVLHKETGIFLSPAYDLLNVNLINPKDDEELGLTLNGKKKKLKLADFIVLANVLAIPEKACQNTFNKFREKNDEVKDWIDRSFLQQEEKERYWQIWIEKQKLFDAMK